LKAIELAKAFGYMTEGEVKLLQSCVISINKEEPVLVNIGAGAGTSSLAMREVAPKASLYSVDKSPGGPLGGLEGERNAFKDAHLSYPIQILGDSEDAAKYYANNIGLEIDLIFIDDGHMESDVIRDIASWIPRLKRYGAIIFHDYGAERWPDVKKVVDEYARINTWHKLDQVDTLIAFEVA
jgi:predicted O-methyltransferase YrrM